jgi:GTP pyrophosphokinase
MVPLDYELDTGDICSIKTSKTSSGPTDAWLNIAKSSHARSKIRTFLNKRDRELLIEDGKRKVDEALPEYDFEKKIDDALVKKYYDTQEVHSIDTLYYSIGKGNISARAALNKLSGKADSIKDEAKILEQINRSQPKKANNEHGILVDGLINPKLRLSNCCNPIPGDPIVGYVTKGMGIAIHRDNCNNVKTNNKDRFIDVSWSQSVTSSKYRVALKVTTFSRNNIVVELINSISSHGITITNVNTSKNSSGENVVKLGLEVQNISQLDKMMIALRNIKDVYDVERVNR